MKINKAKLLAGKRWFSIKEGHDFLPQLKHGICLFFAIVMVLMASGNSIHVAQAKGMASAERFVRPIAQRTIAVARRKISRAQRIKLYHRLVRSYADIPAIALFALGRYRRKLPTNRRAEYYRLVGIFIARFFADYTNEFDGRRIEITKSRARGKHDIILDANIIYNGRRPSAMQWRLLRHGRRYRVFDIKLLGVWLTLQLRSRFVNILRANNGNFDKLISKLKQSR